MFGTASPYLSLKNRMHSNRPADGVVAVLETVVEIEVDKVELAVDD